MQVRVGSHVGPYRIIAPLGAGGMGEVYRARDEKLGRDIALKILPADLSTNAEALRRFETEARAASALNHPNIVTIYEVSREGDVGWIAMELVDGEDLRTLVEREALPLKTALRIAVKVAEGLAAAHEKSIVHRDLKPDNVMISRDGFVKILDFGLAKQVRVLASDDTTVPHTVPGSVFGTVSYMSPEQARGREMDYRSDQFSFGVMLYEMLTRKRVFDRDSKPETMTAIIRDEVVPPSQVNELVPRELDRIVLRCLAKQPRDRYGSTRDLAHDLREVRESLTSPSHRSGAAGSQPMVVGLRARRSTWIAAASIVAVLAAGAVGVRMYQKSVEVADINAVAVMPFRDLTGTTEGRLLADGISEMVATRLADVRDLRVAAPYDGVPISERDDIRAAARRKRVDAVVRGSVLRGGGGEVRVTYALVHARNGRTLLSNSATRRAEELFALEDSISGDLLSTLGHSSPPRVRAAAVTLGPEDQRRFVEALGLLQRVRDEGSVDRAIATLESLLGNARESGAVNAMLARALLYKSALARRPALIEQATIYAQRGVNLSANDPEAHVTLGDLNNASGRHKDALASFERALALRPEHPKAILGTAVAYAGLGRAADAEQMYKKAVALRPDDGGTFMRYGSFCFRKGRYADAVSHYQRATELMPDFSQAYSNLGAALQALERHPEALAAYEKSIAIKPTAPGYTNLGALQFQLGRYDDAVRSHERATQLAPGDFMMWANLAEAQRFSTTTRDQSAEAFARAIKTARDALAINPDDAYARASLALCLAKSGDTDAAQREIRRALEIDPTQPRVLYKAGVISFLRGNTESAISWIERAVKAGYPAGEVQTDPELAPLRGLPSFRSAVESTK